MKVFISYCQQDKEIVSRIADGLCQHGVHVLLNDDFVKPGELWVEKIHEAFDQSDIFLIIVSQHTSENRFQTSEIALAVTSQRKSPSKRVIPVLVDNQADLPFFLRDVAHCDFSSKEKYQQNLELLVKAVLPQQRPDTDFRENDRRKIEMIRAEKELFIKGKKKTEYRKTWLMTSFICILGGISLQILIMSAQYNDMISIDTSKSENMYYLLGVATGIIFSIPVFLILSKFLQRTFRREGEDAR